MTINEQVKPIEGFHGYFVTSTGRGGKQMRTPLLWKIRTAFVRLIMKLCRHEYGCCESITRDCRKCPYVLAEQAAQAGDATDIYVGNKNAEVERDV